MTVKAWLIHPIYHPLGQIGRVEGHVTENGIVVTSPLVEGITVPWQNIAYYR
jgi:hypothetical protein